MAHFVLQERGRAWQKFERMLFVQAEALSTQAAIGPCKIAKALAKRQRLLTSVDHALSFVGALVEAHSLVRY